MIKFFRRIRQKLIAENKVSKYLTYAIGEIVLVVLGILIALQLNSLKEENKRRNSELQFYQELKSDLLANKAEIENELAWDWLDVRIPLADSLYNQLLKDTPDKEIVNYIIGNQIKAYRTFNNANSSYTYMSNEGYSFIRNKSIRLGTTNLYETNFSNIYFNLKIYESFINNDLKPLVYEYGDFNANHEFELQDISGLQNDRDFKNRLNNYRYHLKLNYWVFQRALDNIDKIIQEINNELIMEGIETNDESLVDNNILRQTVGKYEDEDGATIHVFEDNGRLFYKQNYPRLERHILNQKKGFEFELYQNDWSFKVNASNKVNELSIFNRNTKREFQFVKSYSDSDTLIE